MRTSGRPDRGERARVAARVRALVRTPAPTPDAPATAERPTSRDDPWVPGMRPPPRHESSRPGWRQRFRWDPGPRGLIALGLAVIVVVAATAWWLAADAPRALPVHTRAPTGSPVSVVSTIAQSTPTAGSTVTSAASPSTSGTGSVVVDVAGKVRRPGVYTLPAGSRVYEALRAAGGVRAGASTLALNLAEQLTDGEQIVVGVRGATPVTGASPTAGAVTGSSGASAPVNLNTATLEDLEALPGIGPVLGQNILDWRAANGSFTSVDQLRDVSGIGDVRLAQLRPLVTV